MRARFITRRGVLALLAVLALASVAAACVPPPPPPPPDLAFPCSASPGSPVSGNDPLRTGWYPDQPGLNPSAGGTCGFGEQWSTGVDGQVYSAPQVDPGAGAHGTLLVATETNHVYGLDAQTGQQVWHRSDLGVPWNAADLSCGDLTPWVGITSAPAIDAATHTAYLFSKTYVSGTSGPAQYKAHAIDVATGAEKPNFPVTISGAADNDPTASFDATYHLQRPGLLLMNGVVYAAFGGHCDVPPYRGWVVGINGTSGATTARWTDVALVPPSAPEVGKPGGGIWQAGGPLLSDKPGEILLVAGNGVVPPAPLSGTTPPPQLGESAIRLKVQPGGKLLPTDFWAPCNAQALADADQDVGSGAPLVLPDSFGTSGVPHPLVVVGKEGPIYLLNRDHLGGFQQGSPGSCVDGSGHRGDDIGSSSAVPNAPGVWATPSMWPGDGGSIYVPNPTFYGANAGKFTSYNVVDVGGQPTLSLAGQSSDPFGYGSSSAIVTSDGTSSGSALVWVTYFPVNPGQQQNGELRAYDANPADGVLTLRGSWPIGTGNKFTTPTVQNGRMYVVARDGTANGRVLGFGVGGPGATQAPARGPTTANVPPGAGPDREG
ncbi:MAG TPA: PQQ-binding-like beta-propeller repeat protein [Acidimicrobiia bacterium]|nr:PQQ-binding-like beta-propeller repeat protein [Acidimicrobiia bacterium]